MTVLKYERTSRVAVIENMGIYVGIFLEADQNVRTWFWKNHDIAALRCSAVTSHFRWSLLETFAFIKHITLLIIFQESLLN